MVEASYELLGVRIGAAPFGAVVERVLRAPETGECLALHFATVHSIVEADRNPELRDALNVGLTQPDGMPLVWLGRRAQPEIERVCGPDFLPALAGAGLALGRSHYFYGGAPGVPEALAAALAARFPGLRVVGTLSPPFRPLTADEDAAITRQINEARPDYVWVGLGAPKQDLWVSSHRAALDAVAVLAVGAAFDFHAGRKRRAPRWMQRTGTEWLFRLLSEPRRLAGRYTRVNLAFIVLVLRERLRRGRAAR